MADAPDVVDTVAARVLARFTEQTAIRRLARGLPGELLLADHEGDIVDPTLDPGVFTTVPPDLAHCIIRAGHDERRRSWIIPLRRHRRSIARRPSCRHVGRSATSRHAARVLAEREARRRRFTP